jgi:hypothetical protein
MYRLAYACAVVLLAGCDVATSSGAQVLDRNAAELRQDRSQRKRCLCAPASAAAGDADELADAYLSATEIAGPTAVGQPMPLALHYGEHIGSNWAKFPLHCRLPPSRRVLRPR